MQRIDRTPTTNDINELSKAGRSYPLDNYYGFFGATRYWQKYTPEELVGQLKKLGEKLGRRPTDRDINRTSKEGFCASAATFARMFEGLPTAYRKAGFEKVKPRSYSDKEILDTLKNLAKEKGRMPTYHELVTASKAGKCPSPGTIFRRIGKLTNLKSKFDSV